ncbi:unnamed protein product [Oreochromis niloticus]|nr:unnamed protein product [Mustela putorius furo]
MKRLKTRKERSQIRGGWKETSKIKSNHHHHHHRHRQSNLDMAHLHNCCHASCHCSSRRNPPFPSIVPSVQEPSIITDGRLTGHHGLFNHEVKSIDFERLLSEQPKLEEQRKEKNTVISHSSSALHNSAPMSTDGLLGADTDVGSCVPFRKNTDPASKDHTDCQEKEKKNMQFDSKQSDVTTEEKPQQQLALSCESFQSSHSSKHSFLDVLTTETKWTCVVSENSRESLLTPVVDRDNIKTFNTNVKERVISTLVQTPTLSSANSCEIQDRTQDPKYVMKFVSAVAARLCHHLKLPSMSRRDVLSESREVLLNSLRKRHGPWLQENLLRLQQHRSFAVHPTKKAQDHDQEPTRKNEEDLFAADTSFNMPANRHASWKTSPQPHCSQKQVTEWLASPADTADSVLDDILRPSLSPPLFMNFQTCEAPESILFAPSTTLCQREVASVPENWQGGLNWSKSKNSAMFGSFENSFMDQSSLFGNRSLQYSGSNPQPFFPYQLQLPDTYTGEPMHIAQQEDPFGTGRYSCVPSFPAPVHHQSNHFQSSSQFSHPSACSPLKSQHTDMMHYPPSFILERDPAPSLSAFLSPEQWSFPPMRLY